MLRLENKRAVLAGTVFLAAAVVVFVGCSWRLAERQMWVVHGAEHEDFLAFDVKAYTDCVGAFLHANGIQ